MIDDRFFDNCSLVHFSLYNYCYWLTVMVSCKKQGCLGQWRDVGWGCGHC